MSGARINARQVALVQLAKRQLDLDNATYRAILRRVADVESSTELDEAGLHAVLAELRRLGFVHVRRTDPDRLSALQWKLLDTRAKAVGYEGLDDPAFVAWVAKRWDVEHPRKLTRATLQPVLEGLRSFRVNRAAKPRARPRSRRVASVQPSLAARPPQRRRRPKTPRPRKTA